jgi:RNase P/RNase MRP subunit POP5
MNTLSRRYFLIRLVSDRPVSSEQFGKAVADSVRRCFGEFGLSRIDPRLIRFDPQRSEAVLACNKDGAEELQAAIAMLSNELDDAMAALVLRVSGTIKGLRKKK